MRVLRISHSAAIAAWRGRERALHRRGDDVALITARRWHAGGVWVDLDAAADENVIPARTFGTHPALFVYDPRPLWRALGEKWDVIDIHEEPFALSTAEVLVMRMLRRNPAPVVLYTAQNLYKRYPVPFRWLERWALRRAAGISACNTEAARITEAKGFAGRARVIPLGVDAVSDTPLSAAAAAPPTAADVHIAVGMLGRLVPEKGIATLLDALVLEPRLHARIGGSGPLESALADWARQRGIEDRVELIGAVDPTHVDEFYRAIDVLAVPSVPRDGWTEQFGRVAVEAMASDVPVVSSDAGALPDVVGGAGIVVPAQDAAALATALAEAAGPRREELVAAGQVRAAECSWDSVAGAYQELYRSVVRVPVTEPVGVSGGSFPEIVVVAYGAPQMLRRALEPVAALPVTVIDNSSLPEIAALCAELGVRYRDSGANLGFGAAVNLALSDRLLPGADLLLLNPDAEIDPAGIEKLQRALRADPSLASVGPAQVDGDGRRARVEWPFPAPHRAVMDALGLGRFERGARFVIGSVLLLRAEALAQVGGFDERFFLYAEETDWSYRAHRLGWHHRAVGEVTARHLAGGTSTDPRRREAYFFASQERYFRKHFGTAGWAVARVAGWSGALVRSAVLRGERRAQARRRAAIYRLGPVRVEGRFRPRATGAHKATP
ncbi:glycosyltransferase [Microbacterium sp.]|uniref:glycosyltransferase n=1 Tax=Microbacterium sp. TaxID=51671 RepID=UPI0027345959|nr:glycosyltransferase [Microbacterium sp.]MDP3953044.1 glycosyltransferase [Microbacterium sp.]